MEKQHFHFTALEFILLNKFVFLNSKFFYAITFALFAFKILSKIRTSDYPDNYM